MQLTQAEAKTKWCPFARVALYVGAGGAAANRHPSDGSTDRNNYPPAIEDDTRCLGAGCMAWRWVGELPDPEHHLFDRKSRSWPVWRDEGDLSLAEAKARAAPPRPSDIPQDWESVPLTGTDWDNADGGQWREPAEAALARYVAACDAQLGFCGLAGPEGK